MPSSTQFSIRGLLIVTTAAAVILASTMPWFRQLGPQYQLRAVLYLLLLAGMMGAVACISILRRRSAEKLAGRLLSRTDIGSPSLRRASLVAAVFLSAVACGVCLLLAFLDSAPITTLVVASVVRYSIVCLVPTAAFTVPGLFLYWWWGTGFLTTEAFQNGLVVDGVSFLPWTKIISYQRATRFVLTVSGRRRTSRIEIRVAVKDRDQWEQIFADHGVPSSTSPEQDNAVSPAEPPDSQHATE